MPLEEIVTELSLRLFRVAASPTEIVYAVSMQDLLSAIVKRMGKDALSLNASDLLAARDEVRAAIAHNLDEREYIQMGLDAWDITRTL